MASPKLKLHRLVILLALLTLGGCATVSVPEIQPWPYSQPDQSEAS